MDSELTIGEQSFKETVNSFLKKAVVVIIILDDIDFNFKKVM